MHAAKLVIKKGIILNVIERWAVKSLGAFSVSLDFSSGWFIGVFIVDFVVMMRNWLSTPMLSHQQFSWAHLRWRSLCLVAMKDPASVLRRMVPQRN